MYKTVSREVFVVFFALKKFSGDLRAAEAAVLEIEQTLGTCDFAIPADVAL